MAKGSIRYKTGQNLEPVSSAIIAMGQQASKKDKPEILGQKIKAISTDATALEGNVLNGQTFYAGGTKKTGNMANRGAWTGRIGVNGKIAIPAGYHNGQGYVDQSITAKGSITPAVSVTGNNPMYVRMSQGAYFTNASSGYPETSVTLAQLRGAGLALQSELTAMTNDRNNWMNVANSRYVGGRYTLSSLSCEYYYAGDYFFRSSAITLPISKFITACVSAKVKFSGPGMNGYTFYFPIGGQYCRNTRYVSSSSGRPAYDNRNIFMYSGYTAVDSDKQRSYGYDLFSGDNQIKLCAFSYSGGCASATSGCEFQDIVIDYIGIE